MQLYYLHVHTFNEGQESPKMALPLRQLAIPGRVGFRDQRGEWS